MSEFATQNGPCYIEIGLNTGRHFGLYAEFGVATEMGYASLGYGAGLGGFGGYLSFGVSKDFSWEGDGLYAHAGAYFGSSLGKGFGPDAGMSYSVGVSGVKVDWWQHS
jgi:hypothetical protein